MLENWKGEGLSRLENIKNCNMEVKIKIGNEMLDATIEMIDSVMVVSPKVEKFEPIDRTDWQQVRIQAAIAAMQGLLSNEKQVHIKVSEAAYISVLYADALIEGLKGE